MEKRKRRLAKLFQFSDEPAEDGQSEHNLEKSLSKEAKGAPDSVELSEWQLIAEILDKIFFVVSLSATVSLLIGYILAGVFLSHPNSV